MAEQWADSEADPRFVGYFELFNAGKFYEAHDVLEDLWLEDRAGPQGDLFKGLIQLAGGFVLAGKERMAPAERVFLAASLNIEKYSGSYDGFRIEDGLGVARAALEALREESFVLVSPKLERS